MKTGRTDYDILPFPPLQHQMTDWLEVAHRQHTMHALIEVDVTDARQAIREYRARTGAPLSLTAFVIACLARAIDADKAVQAYRLGRRHLVLFADVDVATLVEREVDGARIPVTHIIRAANTKSPAEIQQEIQAVQADPRTGTATFVRVLPRWLQTAAVHGLPFWLVLPAAVRRAVVARLWRIPRFRKRYTGTVGVTAVGMFGHGTGWGIPSGADPLCLTIGGVAKKPGVVGECMEVREYLCLTLSLNHDTINGAPAARFIQRLTGLIESGAGLHDPDQERERSFATLELPYRLKEWSTGKK